MLSTNVLFELAELAEASYAKFDLYRTTQVKDALIANGFSAEQATVLLDSWQIASGGHQPNTASGYSSTLFKNTDGSYVLAFRGTEGALSGDLWKADIGDIVGDGLATKQIIDMYNEWQHITAAQGASYNAAHLSYLATESAAYTEAMLKLADSDPDIRAFAQEAIDALKARTDIVFDGTAAYTIELVDSATLFTDGRATGLGLAADIAANGLTVTIIGDRPRFIARFIAEFPQSANVLSGFRWIRRCYAAKSPFGVSRRRLAHHSARK